MSHSIFVGFYFFKWQSCSSKSHGDKKPLKARIGLKGMEFRIFIWGLPYLVRFTLVVQYCTFNYCHGILNYIMPYFF